MSRTGTENTNTGDALEASFRLAGYLLESYDEESAILAAMRVGNDLLSAGGCVFIPFNEWKQSLPVLKFGETPEQFDTDWHGMLTGPATRQACKICQVRQGGPECVLLQDARQPRNTFCVALRGGGREIGMLSYFLPSQPQVTEDQHRFLAEMVRLTGLALDSLQVNAQQLEAARRALVSVDLDKKLAGLDAENGQLLEQLEYRAVLDERTRLAREMHDGLAQTLAFLKIEAARMQSYVDKGELASVVTTLKACYRTLSDAYIDARQAIDNLRRTPDENLADWLKATADDFMALTGLNVELSVSEIDFSIAPRVKAQLIRIVQEALTNVRKHAQACSVSISVFELNGDAVIEIQDNGRGFLPDDVRPASQYGLRSMRERAETIGVDFQVTSVPGKGTNVHVQFPLNEEKESR